MLKAQSTHPYEPTAEDALWLSRAVAAEGRPYDRVARALVNLFMLQRSKGNAQTLTRLVRAYAQPVNPRWFPDGDLFAKRGVPSALEAEQARRRRDVHSTRASFPPAVRIAVADALQTSFLSDVTDYAVPSLDASKKGYVARGTAVPGENRFWTRAPGWRGYLGNGTVLMPALMLLASAYVLWKGLRA